MQIPPSKVVDFGKHCEDSKMLRSNVAKEAKNLIKTLFFCVNR